MKNMKERIGTLLLCAALACCASGAWAASDIYEVEPTFSPYSAGVVRRDVLEAALAEVNYIRGLAGVPNNLTLNDDYNTRAQHGAVLMDANDVMSHTPSKPTDMSQAFYELGYDGTSHGNICSGWISQNGVKTGNLTLSKSIGSWMDDDDDRNIAHVGHRRWILNPRARQTGFGISTRRGYSVMYVIEERGDTLTYEEYEALMQWPVNKDYVSWPVEGQHPRRYFGADVPWSVTLNCTVFDECDDNSVAVRLTRESDGRTWTFRSAQSNGYFNVSHESYAYDECIVFRPDGVSEYGDGEVWSVEITGLKKLGTGESASISYSTTFTGASSENRNNRNNNGNSNANRNGDEGGGCNGGFGALALLLGAGGFLRTTMRNRAKRGKVPVDR